VNLTYSNIDIDNDGVGNAQADVDNYRIAGTLGYRAGSAFANAEIGYSFGNVDTSRDSVVGSISGEFDVQGFTANATAGYDLTFGSATITPSAGLRYARFNSDDFTEVGGLNLQIQQDDVSYLEGVVGLTAKTTTEIGGATVTPYIRGAYAYDFIGDDRDLTASFVGASPISLSADNSSQSRFELGLGLDASISENVTLGVAYEGGFASDFTSHAGVLRLGFKF